MRKVLASSLVIILLIATSSILAQERATSSEQNNKKPTRVARYERRITGDYRLEEDSISLVEAGAKEPSARVAFRYCTQKPLSASVIYRSNASFSTVTRYLTTFYDFSPKNFLFLRSSNCAVAKNPKPKFPVMEMWVIPDGADLPPNDEAVIMTEDRKLQPVKNNKNCQ